MEFLLMKDLLINNQTFYFKEFRISLQRMKRLSKTLNYMKMS